jgi:hypothetical protein
MKLRFVLAAAVAGIAAVAAGTAGAAGPTAGSCATGLVQPGVYSNYTVTGDCLFAGGTVTINGNLFVAPGASLNAHDMTFAVVHVRGNAIVGPGGTLGLGQYGAPFGPQSGTVVDGNVIANQPQSLYLSAITIHGNLISSGGSGPGLNYPTKDDIVDGNVIIQGWSGLWIGLLRTKVGGNVIFNNNAGTQVGDEGPFIGVPDSSEIADNTIRGNLICFGNTPAAQIGDSGGGLNTVGGNALGECASLKK